MRDCTLPSVRRLNVQYAILQVGYWAMVPLWNGDKKIGALLDIVNRKAFEIDAKGNRQEIPVPADKTEVLDEFYQQLCESVAETSEAKMEKFFGGEAFTQEEIIEGLHAGVRDLTLCPVLCGSAFTGIGTLAVLDAVVKLFPNPLEIPNRKGMDDKGEPVEIELTEEGNPYAFVFKTTSDQYGRFSYFKVVSGKVTSDMKAETKRGMMREVKAESLLKGFPWSFREPPWRRDRF